MKKTNTREFVAWLMKALDEKDLMTLRIVGFLPYTSIVCATKVQDVVYISFSDDERNLYNELLEKMVRTAKELKGKLLMISRFRGTTIEPHMDNKVVFLVILDGRLEWLGFKDGNVWRGQGIGGDHI